MVTIQIDPKYITDSMLDSMASDEVLNLLKSVLNEIRKEEVSNAPEANMYADQIDKTTTVEEALEIIKKPSNFTKKMKASEKTKATSEITKAKLECPYHGINYAPSSNSFYFRINQVVVVKRVDPIYVAMVRDLYMDTLGINVPKNYEEFNAVKRMLEALSKEELEEIEATIEAKVEKHNLR